MPGFIPTANSFGSYGWKGSNAYRPSDIPVLDTTLRSQFAYEWFDQSGRYASGRNPAFHSGAAGRLVPSLAQEGLSNRILRGFIRRADYDPADSRSTARLYFMYNPENITRDYVSYLDQGALDPFNTVFQSGNLVPPPSFMDFTFSLLFDRQDEAQDPQHPGVFVDYEYFDLVVRNVDPSIDSNSTTATALPDNGVMMVNPRDITVVFSPQITVQGRPSNARVAFQRFTHRMVPTRMQIDLTMRVTYFGPMRDMQTYEREEQVTAATIPWDPAISSPFTMTRVQIEEGAKLFMEKMSGGDMLKPEEIQALIAIAEAAGTLAPGTNAQWNASMAANEGINASITEFAKSKAEEHNSQYVAGRRIPWATVDCSSFVWAGFRFHEPPFHETMKWDSGGGGPDTSTMIEKCSKGDSPVQPVFETTSTVPATRATAISSSFPNMVKGDLIFRKKGLVAGHAQGHVGFVYSNDPAGKKIEILDAGSPSTDVRVRPLTYDFLSKEYTHCYRPMLGTPDLSGNRDYPVPGAT